MHPIWAIGLAGLLLIAAGSAEAGPKVVSLDQCADQYVIKLAPRSDILAVSTRADDLDSYYRVAARDLPKRRATLEAVLAARPDLVVRVGSPGTELEFAL